MPRPTKLFRNPGSILAISGIVVFLGIQTAEMNYVGKYSTNQNYISDLGTNSSLASIIFNFSMLIAGIFIIISSLRFKKIEYSKYLTTPLLIYGIGTAGVGIFPTIPFPWMHGFSALLLFLTGPVAAFNSRRYLEGTIKKVALILSALSTFFLVDFAFVASSSNYQNNIGGLERWAIYPITMWLILFGSYIAHKELK